MFHRSDWNSSRYHGEGRIGFVTVAGVLACALCLAAAFFPYILQPESGRNITILMTGDGKFYIFYPIVGAILFLLKRRILPLLPAVRIAITAIFAVLDYVGVTNYTSALIQKGVGFYLLIAGAILLVVAAVIRLFIPAGEDRIS